MNVCDNSTTCVDVTLSGVACYLKNGIGASQTGVPSAYGARLLSSKSKSGLTPPSRRRRSRKNRIATDPRVHPREIKGGHPRMLLGEKDERACPGGCSGWGGPASTFAGTATQTVLSTSTTYVFSDQTFKSLLMISEAPSTQLSTRLISQLPAGEFLSNLSHKIDKANTLQRNCHGLRNCYYYSCTSICHEHIHGHCYCGRFPN